MTALLEVEGLKKHFAFTKGILFSRTLGHIKAVTAMSPLQYQKRLRLQHARRLLITNEDAARAGYAVGYESASQFSREYRRQFSRAPREDAMLLSGRGANTSSALT